MNRTRGFVNLNRFKSGRSIKRLKKAAGQRQWKGQKRGKNKSDF